MRCGHPPKGAAAVVLCVVLCVAGGGCDSEAAAPALDDPGAGLTPDAGSSADGAVVPGDEGGGDAGPLDAAGAADVDLGDPTKGGFEAPAVGVVETTITSGDGLDHELVVWYPALPPAGGGEPKNYFFILEGQAQDGLEALPGSWPLVLFSHGTQAIPYQSIDLCEAWARAGYVVAAPSHTGNTIFDNSAPKAEVAERRPRDLVAARQAVAGFAADPGHPLYGAADDSRVAVAGHSFGGMTTLMSAGAAIDVLGAQAACEAGVNLRGACSYIATLEGELHPVRPPELADVRAAIALTPAFFVVFGELGLAEVTAPTFVGVGGLDTITPADEDGLAIYDALPSPRALLHLYDVGHYGFSNFCDIPDIEGLSKGQIECDNPAFTDHHLVMDITARLTVPWLDMHLKDDAAQAERITEQVDEGDWPELLEVRYDP